MSESESSVAVGNPVAPAGLNMDEKYCSSCAGVIKKAAELCPKCGVRQTAATAGKSEKSWIVLLLISFFLGSFGIDRLYAGQIGFGIIKMVVCLISWVAGAILLLVIVGAFILAIPSIWWFIDFIIVVCGKMKDGEGNYIKG